MIALKFRDISKRSVCLASAIPSTYHQRCSADTVSLLLRSLCYNLFDTVVIYNEFEGAPTYPVSTGRKTDLVT